MADKIVVMNAGRIEQVGTPMELYDRPATVFVAGFIGSPRMNLIEGPAAAAMGAVTYGIRPEHLHLSADAAHWHAKVRHIERLGADSIVYLDVDGSGAMMARVGGADPRLWQGRVTVRANFYVNLDRIIARAELLRQPGASFTVHPSHRAGPQADPTGSGLGASSPTITGIAANNRDVTLAGLPGGYVLTEGDFLSFSYLSNPRSSACGVTGDVA